MKRSMLLVFGIFVVVAFAMGGTANATDEGEKVAVQSGEAKEILKKCAEALKKIKVAEYHGKYEGTGWVRQYVADVEGHAVLGEPAEHDVPRFQCEVKITPPNSEETAEFTVGADGDLYYLVDPEKKIVYADMDDAVLGSQQRNFQRVLLPDFVAKEPLEADLKVDNIELKETVDVDGEACHQVRVIQSETREVIWYIAAKDFLPRRVDRVYRQEAGGEEALTRLDIANLKAKSTLDTASFKLTVPPGYMRTDDFAP